MQVNRAEAQGASLTPDPVEELTRIVARGNVVVLSGAGLSTESGIPDYRGPSGALRKHTPMTYQSFTRDPAARHRYWARSYLGWRQIATALPNAGHRAVAEFEAAGLLAGIITQNVDGLHQAGGARSVIELHGALARVSCQNCLAISSRQDLDARLRAANRAWRAEARLVNPDGDVELPDEELDSFVMVDCPACGGGPLKPDVVFFGENVPKARVADCFDLIERAGALLVLGSSLTVMSGYRFVIRARERAIPIAIVNRGRTRGDDAADILVDAPLGSVLPAVTARLWDDRCDASRR